MRIRFKGTRELHTNTIHSENQLLSLSYLVSDRNSPVPNTSGAVIYSSARGNVIELPRVSSTKRKVTKQQLANLAHLQTHMEEDVAT